MIQTQKELQEWVTLKLREVLDPIVIKAGYNPEDYEIVWKPLDPPEIDFQSSNRKVRK